MVGQPSSTLVYVHGDHLGSVSAATSNSGGLLNQQAYTPFGEVRSGDIPQTTLDFTGQRKDGTGLLYYHARYYDPALGKFVSPDTIVPGVASGAGGALGSLGYDDRTALTPLTVAFREPGFVAGLGEEHRFTAGQGFWFLLSEEDQAQAKPGWGPDNPQALNR